MLLDPINSVTSVGFYKRVAKQSLGRSFLYLAYLALLFSLTAVLAVKFRVMPAVDGTFAWLEKATPILTFSGGKMAMAAPSPVILRHPSVPEVTAVIDAERVEPVTPQIMEQNKALAYLTGNALYVMQQPGKVEVYDFSKASNAKPFVVDEKFFREAAKLMRPIIYVSTLIAAFFVFLVWKGAASVVYSMLASVINRAAAGGLEFWSLFNISVHAQTLVVVLQAMLLFTPGRFLGDADFLVKLILSFALTGTYITLAIRANAARETPEA